MSDHPPAAFITCSSLIKLQNFIEVRAYFLSSFPEYLETDEGEEIRFTCVLSDSDASVFWLKDGKPLQSNDRIMIKEDGNKRKLTIRNAKLEDSGKYMCSTADKKTQSEAELIVRGK